MIQLSDYTPQQVEQFEAMRKALDELNKSVDPQSEKELALPYSKEQIAAYSQYCQVKLRAELSEEI